MSNRKDAHTLRYVQLDAAMCYGESHIVRHRRLQSLCVYGAVALMFSALLIFTGRDPEVELPHWVVFSTISLVGLSFLCFAGAIKNFKRILHVAGMSVHELLAWCESQPDFEAKKGDEEPQRVT